LKRAFNKKYEEDISEFISENEDLQEGEIPWEGKLVEDLDEDGYDSYGSEDSKLRRIYYFGEFDIYVEFTGTRQSYNGEDWDAMKEVKQVEKTILTWE